MARGSEPLSVAARGEGRTAVPAGRNAVVITMVAVLSLTVLATLGIGYAITVGTIRDQARRLMEAVSAQGISRIVEFLQPTWTIGDLQFQLAATGLSEPGAQPDLERFFLEHLKRKPDVAG